MYLTRFICLDWDILLFHEKYHFEFNGSSMFQEHWYEATKSWKGKWYKNQLKEAEYLKTKGEQRLIYKIVEQFKNNVWCQIDLEKSLCAREKARN